MRSLLAMMIVVVGCKHETPAPPATSKPEAVAAPAAKPAAKPAPSATLAPGQKLGFEDFWEVAGISRTDTPATLEAKWGEPEETADGGTTLRYEGASVTFHQDRSVQLDVMSYGARDRAFQ